MLASCWKYAPTDAFSRKDSVVNTSAAPASEVITGDGKTLPVECTDSLRNR
jgi:hypothetical protein